MTISASIERHLAADTLCVFPSEVAAEYWRRHGARHTGSRALRTDRLVSWDTFREDHLSVESALIPSNRILKRLFAAELCHRIATEPALSSIIPTEFAAEAPRFARSIARILPSLTYLEDDITAGRISLPIDVTRDYSKLRKRYLEFLNFSGLFEPDYLAPRRPDHPESTLIVFPELIDGFDRFSHLLDSAETIDPSANPSYRHARFESTPDEVDSVVSRIAALISDGVHPEEIVVSVAGLESLAADIGEAARIRGLPLDIRSGRAIGDYPTGGVFARIRACEASGFDLELCRPLFLDPRIPWRNRPLNADLIRFGIDQRIGRSEDPGGTGASGAANRTDMWLSRLAGAGEERLAGYYRSLRRCFGSLIEAETFSDLRRSVLDFVNGFLDTSSGSSAGRRVFESAIDTLAKFEAAETVVGSRRPGVRPFGIWLEHLAEEIYVVPGDREAVGVYPYRVTAGICPAHHFVVNVADPNARISRREYPFLPMHLTGGDAGAEPADVTSVFLRGYASSGEIVEFSSSNTGPAGRMLLPTEILSESEVRDGAVLPAGISPYAVEPAFWRGERELAPRIATLQRCGLLRAAGPQLADGRRDFTSETVDEPALRDSLAGRTRTEAGLIRVSPTALDAWSNCRFHYLVSRLLGVEDETYRVEFSDPLLEGETLHDLAAAFVNAAGEPESRVDRVIEGFLKTAQTRFPQPHPLLFHYLVERFRQALRNLETWRFSLLPTRSVERVFEFEHRGVVIHGRIDRIADSDSGPVLIDYKRNRIPKKTEIARFDQASTYQIPLYVALVESSGDRVAAACYYSLFGEQEAPVYVEGEKKSWLLREELDAFVAVALSRAEEMRQALEAGDFRTPRARGGCDGCPIRPICRERFVVRRGAK